MLLLHILILHQTTTTSFRKKVTPCCFISWFYIKPQHAEHPTAVHASCFISWFYIKPQPFCYYISRNQVASYLDSTSNHNEGVSFLTTEIVASYLDSTSNHNCFSILLQVRVVASYLDSTSNHNNTRRSTLDKIVASYFDSTSNHNNRLHTPHNWQLLHILILHQTTTWSLPTNLRQCCFIFWFYIKPQPTIQLYTSSASCFIFWFYIKPQHRVYNAGNDTCCFIFWFYIKPQPSASQ